jgi:RHS repeat-associated protein
LGKFSDFSHERSSQNEPSPRDGTTPATIIANIRTGLGMDEFMSRSEIVVSGGTTTTTNRHFLTNHLGSVLALTDAAGVITKNYKYEPYGKVTTTGETSANPYQYTGRENDIAATGTNPTGLYFYRARYYDAAMQRFISEDPIGFADGYHVYRYVADNPIYLSDPSGLMGGGGNHARCSTNDCCKTKCRDDKMLCAGVSLLCAPVCGKSALAAVACAYIIVEMICTENQAKCDKECDRKFPEK